MTIATGRLSLPRITNGPLLLSRKESADRREDWSDIEAMLASSDPIDRASRTRSRRRSALLGSAFVAVAACGGILAAATWSTRTNCGLQSNGCAAQVATRAAVQPGATRPVASALAASAQPTRTADAGGSPTDARSSPPVIQGRSVGANDSSTNDAGSSDGGPAAVAPFDDAQPVHHKHHHHRRR